MLPLSWINLVAVICSESSWSVFLPSLHLTYFCSLESNSMALCLSSSHHEAKRSHQRQASKPVSQVSSDCGLPSVQVESDEGHAVLGSLSLHHRIYLNTAMVNEWDGGEGDQGRSITIPYGGRDRREDKRERERESGKKECDNATYPSLLVQESTVCLSVCHLIIIVHRPYLDSHTISLNQSS
jgi:hypothetical protein